MSNKISGPGGNQGVWESEGVSKAEGTGGSDAPATGRGAAPRTAAARRPKSLDMQGVGLQDELAKRLDKKGAAGGATKLSAEEQAGLAELEKRFGRKIEVGADKTPRLTSGEAFMNSVLGATSKSVDQLYAKATPASLKAGEKTWEKQRLSAPNFGKKASGDAILDGKPWSKLSKVERLAVIESAGAQGSGVVVDDHAGDDLGDLLDAQLKAAKDTTPLTRADERIKADIESAIERDATDPVVNAIATALPGFGVDPTESPLTWVAKKGSEVYTIRIRDEKIGLSDKDGKSIFSMMPPPVGDFGPRRGDVGNAEWRGLAVQPGGRVENDEWRGLAVQPAGGGRTDFDGMTAKIKTLYGWMQTE